MGNNSKNKVKAEKTYTRAQAIKALRSGEKAPQDFLSMEDPYRRRDPKNPHQGGVMNHKNYHVRLTAWKLMGCPMPFEGEEKTKFLNSIHVKDTTVVADATEEKEETNV